MSADHVLPGRNGWLFLGEGTNFSISQVTGARKVPPTVQAQWRRAVDVRDRVFGERTLTLICPEKSCVYPEHLPDDLRPFEGRLARVLQRRAPRVLYPLVDAGDKTDLYSRTDTHFTEYGAHQVALEVCEALGVRTGDLQPEWTRRPILGDLGAVMDPPVRSDNTIMANPPTLKVADNGLRNRGRVSRYVRDPDGPHILLFGDSFAGIALARHLAFLAVGTVTFVHSLAFDFEMVTRLEPDFVVGEIAERFLIEPPTDGRALVAVLMEKQVQGLYSQPMLEEFAATLPDFAEVYGPASGLPRRLLAC